MFLSHLFIEDCQERKVTCDTESPTGTSGDASVLNVQHLVQSKYVLKSQGDRTLDFVVHKFFTFLVTITGLLKRPEPRRGTEMRDLSVVIFEFYKRFVTRSGQDS